MNDSRRDPAGGFTLIELVVVVIIIGILASAGLPNFRKMTRRALSAEATNMLGALLTAEWIYYLEQNAFTGDLSDLLVTVPPDPDSVFDYAVSQAGPPVVITARGEPGSSAAGVVVTATMESNGIRMLETTGF